MIQAPEETMIEEPEKCRACGVPIQFILTKHGKHMPAEMQVITVITESGEVVRGYTPHFATCPKADQFRRKR